METERSVGKIVVTYNGIFRRSKRAILENINSSLSVFFMQATFSVTSDLGHF